MLGCMNSLVQDPWLKAGTIPPHPHASVILNAPTSSTYYEHFKFIQALHSLGLDANCSLAWDLAWWKPALIDSYGEAKCVNIL